MHIYKNTGQGHIRDRRGVHRSMPLSSISDLELELDGEVLSLDRSTPRADVTFVSHAHMDHVPRRRSAPVLASPLTFDVMRARTGHDHVPVERTRFGPYTCRFLSSSHAPGATMLHVEGDGLALTFTGDYCDQENAFGVTPEHVPCDVLVMDSTYGDPRHSFPRREEVRADIIRWVKRVTREMHGSIVFGAYTFGKAQELVRILTEDAGVPVLVHEDIAQLNVLCERHGVFVGDAVSASSPEGQEAAMDAFVLVTPPRTVDAARAAYARLTHRPVVTALVTGWGSRRHRCFPLSNHADFQGLMDLVAATSPRHVYTVHGSNKRLARAIADKFGIETTPLGR